MSNKTNNTIEENKFEICQRCGKELDWPAQIANMAVRHGRNDICKECRRSLSVSHNKNLDRL